MSPSGRGDRPIRYRSGFTHTSQVEGKEADTFGFVVEEEIGHERVYRAFVLSRCNTVQRENQGQSGRQRKHNMTRGKVWEHTQMVLTPFISRLRLVIALTLGETEGLDYGVNLVWSTTAAPPVKTSVCARKPSRSEERVHESGSCWKVVGGTQYPDETRHARCTSYLEKQSDTAVGTTRHS